MLCIPIGPAETWVWLLYEMAEGCDYVMPTVPMLDVPLSTHEITSVHTTTNRIVRLLRCIHDDMG